MPKPSIAVVGGETLLGRELRDQLSDRSLPVDIRLVGAEDEVTAILSSHEGEPVVLGAMDADRLQQARLVLLAGSAASSQRALRLLAEADAKPAIIDLTYGLEEHAESRLRAPLVEPAGYAVPEGTMHVMAHPAAVMLAAIFLRLRKAVRIRQSVVQILEPTSERGQAGISELQQQTAAMLSFKPLPKDVFDAQLSFNVLARYGEDAPEKLEDIEQRIEGHLVTLLGINLSAPPVAPVPSLRLIQAPVFHGYSISLWIECESNPGTTVIAEALATAQIEVRSSDLEVPSNVGGVGQSGITVGLIENDRSNPRAFWLWAVADNFRLMVDDAIEIARGLVSGEGR